MKLPILNPYFDIWSKARERPEIRKPLIWAYSWAIPSSEAIHAIADFCDDSPIVEMGAGTGYWAWLLRQAGVEITCFDSRTEAPPHWHPINGGTPASASLDPMLRGQTLLLVWPPLAENGESCMALEALNRLAPRSVIYVGEWRGRTASPEFHAFLESGYRLELELPLPNWPGFRDTLRIYCQT